MNLPSRFEVCPVTLFAFSDNNQDINSANSSGLPIPPGSRFGGFMMIIGGANVFVGTLYYLFRALNTGQVSGRQGAIYTYTSDQFVFISHIILMLIGVFLGFVCCRIGFHWPNENK